MDLSTQKRDKFVDDNDDLASNPMDLGWAEIDKFLLDERAYGLIIVPQYSNDAPGLFIPKEGPDAGLYDAATMFRRENLTTEELRSLWRILFPWEYISTYSARCVSNALMAPFAQDSISEESREEIAQLVLDAFYSIIDCCSCNWGIKEQTFPVHSFFFTEFLKNVHPNFPKGLSC